MFQVHVYLDTGWSVDWMGMPKCGHEYGQVRTTKRSLVEGEACEGDPAGPLERSGN